MQGRTVSSLLPFKRHPNTIRGLHVKRNHDVGTTCGPRIVFEAHFEMHLKVYSIRGTLRDASLDILECLEPGKNSCQALVSISVHLSVAQAPDGIQC